MSDTPPVLLVVVASTRPGRAGLPVATWFAARARDHGAFTVDVADLAEIALPFLDEPKHPRLGEYVHDHTKAWSARVAAADAVVFVMPEYNHGITAPLKNAIDYLNAEWKDKALGIVSYGGVSAGTRAAAMARQVVVPLGMVNAAVSVSIPFIAQQLKDGVLRPDERRDRAAAALLDELARLDGALRPLRAVG